MDPRISCIDLEGEQDRMTQTQVISGPPTCSYTEKVFANYENGMKMALTFLATPQAYLSLPGQVQTLMICDDWQ